MLFGHVESIVYLAEDAYLIREITRRYTFDQYVTLHSMRAEIAELDPHGRTMMRVLMNGLGFLNLFASSAQKPGYEHDNRDRETDFASLAVLAVAICEHIAARRGIYAEEEINRLVAMRSRAERHLIKLMRPVRPEMLRASKLGRREPNAVFGVRWHQRWLYRLIPDYDFKWFKFKRRCRRQIEAAKTWVLNFLKR